MTRAHTQWLSRSVSTVSLPPRPLGSPRPRSPSRSLLRLASTKWRPCPDPQGEDRPLISSHALRQPGCPPLRLLPRAHLHHVTRVPLRAHEDPARARTAARPPGESGIPISFVVPAPGEPDPLLTQNFPPITGSLDTLSSDDTHTTQQSNATSFRKPSYTSARVLWDPEPPRLM